MSIQASWNTALGTMGVLGHLAEQTKLQEYSDLKNTYGTIEKHMAPIRTQAAEFGRAAGQAGLTDEQVTAIMTGDPETSLVDFSNVPQEIMDQAASYREAFTKAGEDLRSELHPDAAPRSLKKAYMRATREFVPGMAKEVGAGFRAGLAERQAIRAEMSQRAQDHATNNDGPANSGSGVARRLEEFGLRGPRGARPDIQFDFMGGND